MLCGKVTPLFLFQNNKSIEFVMPEKKDDKQEVGDDSSGAHAILPDAWALTYAASTSEQMNDAYSRW